MGETAQTIREAWKGILSCIAGHGVNENLPRNLPKRDYLTLTKLPNVASPRLSKHRLSDSSNRSTISEPVAGFFMAPVLTGRIDLQRHLLGDLLRKATGCSL